MRRPRHVTAKQRDAAARTRAQVRRLWAAVKAELDRRFEECIHAQAAAFDASLAGAFRHYGIHP